MNNICKWSVLHQNNSMHRASNFRLCFNPSNPAMLTMATWKERKNRQKEKAWHTWHRATTGCQTLFLRVRERGYLACVCCHLEAGGMPAMFCLCQQWELTQLYQHKKNPIMGNHFGERGKLSDLTLLWKRLWILSLSVYSSISKAEMNVSEGYNVT